MLNYNDKDYAFSFHEEDETTSGVNLFRVVVWRLHSWTLVAIRMLIKIVNKYPAYDVLFLQNLN